MPSHAELAAGLLRDAAKFFRTIGEQNPALDVEMEENAAVYENVARLVENDPQGTIEDDESPP
jgi:hypothetical protein